MTADLVIRGGTVIDGSGAPGRLADVAVTDGIVSAIGDDLNGREELDAAGHVVAPGFVDVHTHYDAQVFWDPALTPSSWHGVTTVVAGNCGFSLAPCRPEHHELMARTLEKVEDMSFATLAAGIPWDFETFPEYLDSVTRHGAALNYGAYVGHTAIRMYVMGGESYERAPTDAELTTMQAIVREAMAAGAMGFASSSNPAHNGAGGRPIPSRLAGPDELRALLQPVREAGRGVVALLPSEKVNHADVYALQREIGVPFTWTALLTLRDPQYHLDKAAMNAAERASGADVWPQVTCRRLVSQITMADPFFFNVVPIWAELSVRPNEEKLARFADPDWRARAWEGLEGRGSQLKPRWHLIKVVETDAHPELIGRAVTDIANERGVTPLDVMLDISVDDQLRSRFEQTIANDDEEGIGFLLQQDGMMLGLSDAGAHVSQICDACLATDLLGNWVRDREVLSLERAVRKLSGEPADVYKLDRRGYLREGFHADITVFDPDTVAPGPLRRIHDFPADGERLVADRPSGMTHVLVNGTPIRKDGEPVAAAVETRPGRILRGS